MSTRGLSRQTVKPLLKGVINIQFTPFKSATEIDEKALRDNTRFMIEQGIVTGRGVQVIGGSNGEAFSLSDEEYKQIIDIVVEEAAGKVPICVGCVRPATQPVISIAQYAEQAGADAVMILPPHYYPDASDDAVYNHYKTIAENTEIGIMIYNNPLVTGKDCSMALYERLAEIDHIVALKETTKDMFKLREVATKLSGRFTLNSNSYRYMLPLDYQLGVVGFNTFFGNIDPEFILKVHDTGLSHDFKRNQELWGKTLELYRFILTKGMYKATSYGKEMARIAGRPMGGFERIPLERPSEEERKILRMLMKKTGIMVSK